MTHCHRSLDEQIAELVERQDHFRRRISRKLHDLQEALNMANKTATELLELMRQERTVDGGILVLLKDLKARVDAAKGNQAAIDTAFAETTADMVAKAQAIIDNTPVAEEQPVPGASQATAAERAEAQRRASQGR